MQNHLLNDKNLKQKSEHNSSLLTLILIRRLRRPINFNIDMRVIQYST